MGSAPVLSNNLTEFFRELVTGAMARQDVRSSEDTEFYLVSLLEAFAKPSSDWFSRPLAVDYLESFQREATDRYLKLKRVADTSLFLSGIFMDALERTVVGSEYYIGLGQLAYGHLAAAESRNGARPFGELSDRFREFVRVLCEISFSELFRSQSHLVRVYTRWLHTRGQRDHQWLVRQGLIPVAGPPRTRHQ